MSLYYKTIGKGKPLVILHGLYGMSDNWITIAKEISHLFTVWLPDLRNHGRSPKYKSHTYPELAEDIVNFITIHRIQKPIILGHSMGGKVAMMLANLYPNSFSQLIIADIAPVNYSLFQHDETNFHKHIIHTLINMPIHTFKSRKEADDWLSAYLHSPTLRAFLLKNLQRDKSNKFFWLLNLPVLEKYLNEIIDGFDNWDSFCFTDINISFLKGSNSTYISKESEQKIRKIFPQAQIITIPDASHWLHADNPHMFVKELLKLTTNTYL